MAAVRLVPLLLALATTIPAAESPQTPPAPQTTPAPQTGTTGSNSEGYQSKDGAPPMLGIEMSPTTLSSQAANGLGMDQGVLVRQVFPSTAASSMGVQPGDVVLSVNGNSIGSMTDLRNEVGFNNVGDPVDVVVSRNGQRIPMRGQFQEWPTNIPREPLDPAVEQRFKDWQRRHLARNQHDVEQLQKAVDDLQNQLQHPEQANANRPDTALRDALGFLHALPAWRVDAKYGLDPSDLDVPAAAPAPAPAPAAPVIAANDAPAWRIAVRLDSHQPKPE